MISTACRHSHCDRLLWTAFRAAIGGLGKTFGRHPAMSERLKANTSAGQRFEIFCSLSQTQLEAHWNLPVIELRDFASLPWRLRTSIFTCDISMSSPLLSKSCQPHPHMNVKDSTDRRIRMNPKIPLDRHYVLTNPSDSSGHSGRFGHEFLGMFLTLRSHLISIWADAMCRVRY
jgi:hypothetical protein